MDKEIIETEHIGQVGIYCKYCSRVIEPSNLREAQFYGESYMYEHDNAKHPEDFSGESEQ